MRCPICHKTVPATAGHCPWCGKDLTALGSRKKQLGVLAFLAVAAIGLWWLHGTGTATTPPQVAELCSTPVGMMALAPQGQSADSLDSLVREANGYLMNNDCTGAIPLLQRVLAHRKDGTGEVLLGKCLVDQNQGEAGLAHLERAESLGIKDAGLQDWITKARLLSKENEDLGQLESAHFHLWVEGNAKTWNASGQLFRALEQIYDSLNLVFDYAPEEKIAAVLYASKEYQPSGLPDWTGALFDGKVRIPINVLEDWPAHRNILKHEVAHAFIRNLSKGYAPTWLDEGLAQKLDGTIFPLEDLAVLGPADYSDLDKQFVSFADRSTATKLYLTSLGMCEILLQNEPIRAGSLRTMRDALQALGNRIPLGTAFTERNLHTPDELYQALKQDLSQHVPTNIDPRSP